MPLPSWAGKYLGLPYRRHARDADYPYVDCWQLCRLIYREEFGIELPSYDGLYIDAAEGAEVRALFEEKGFPWREVSGREASPGDLVWFRSVDDVAHIGILLDSYRFLHCARGDGDSTVERLDSPRWAHAIEGYYRHRDHD